MWKLFSNDVIKRLYRGSPPEGVDGAITVTSISADLLSDPDNNLFFIIKNLVFLGYLSYINWYSDANMSFHLYYYHIISIDISRSKGNISWRKLWHSGNHHDVHLILLHVYKSCCEILMNTVCPGWSCPGKTLL